MNHVSGGLYITTLQLYSHTNTYVSINHIKTFRHYQTFWGSWAQQLVSLILGGVWLLGLLAGLLVSDGTAATVWITRLVLVSDKHWISAVISPSLAQSRNWDEGLSSAGSHTPAGISRKKRFPSDCWLMRLVIECTATNECQSQFPWAPGGGWWVFSVAWFLHTCETAVLPFIQSLG